MFIGRTQELKQLEEAYRAGRNTAVVLYGRLGIGKTELAQIFMKDKPAVFYAARELSELEQSYRMAKELKVTRDDEFFTIYETLHEAMQRSGGKKMLFVIDEFHLLAKSGNAFLQAFIQLMNEDAPCMFLLLSSSVNWVENSMIENLAFAAKSLSGIIKLKEFSFVEMVNRFESMPVEKIIYANAMLGGIPAYLNYWNEKASVKENIVRIFLTKDAPLFNAAEQFLKKELRELGAYNAILATMASGKYKLNDIYARTGFSRAKISVYIKNLIELDVVEKVFSFDASEHAEQMHANAQKGLYRIKDRYLAFWYRYIFPNSSEIECGRGEQVYEKEIAQDMAQYVRECFAGVCEEYLKLMAQYGRLKNRYSNWGTWYGKTGRIDIAAGDADGNSLVGFCRFDNYLMTKKDYNQYKELLSLALLQPKEMYLFSKAGFAEELRRMVREESGDGVKITLVGLEDL
ncbi:MAG: ATP-binding protein [Lachnospiraceae bacterium]|nr:ATP-binding protein [Lachnospiraceae bacterium]